MKGLIILVLFICVSAFLISALAKFILRKMDKKPIDQPVKEYNAYIAYHKLKNKNDKDYQEYLKWLQSNGGGVPVEKTISAEDKKAETKIRNLF